MKKQPIVSIVIPAYNEATYIDRLLEALTKQEFKDFEIIVSDAQSKDGTKEVVDSFKNVLNIKFIEAPPNGPAFGRNQGANQANGAWLLFLDADDDIDDPNFLGTLVIETTKRGWNTSSAKMAVKKSESAINRFGIKIFYKYQKLLAHTKHPVAQGYCIFTNRRVFEQNSGFNEKIHYGEDNEYVTRVGKYGFGFVDATYYYIDLRRNKQEGFLFSLKNLTHEIYRHTHHGKLEKQPFKYEFGKHGKRERD
jgi:glycosyltransferase involved in cell wall biosynthesis